MSSPFDSRYSGVRRSDPLQTILSGTGEHEPIPPALSIRQRTMEEVLVYVSQKYQDYRFGIIYDAGRWIFTVRSPDGMSSDKQYDPTVEGFLIPILLEISMMEQSAKEPTTLESLAT